MSMKNKPMYYATLAMFNLVYLARKGFKWLPFTAFVLASVAAILNIVEEE